VNKASQGPEVRHKAVRGRKGKSLGGMVRDLPGAKKSVRARTEQPERGYNEKGVRGKHKLERGSRLKLNDRMGGKRGEVSRGPGGRIRISTQRNGR